MNVLNKYDVVRKGSNQKLATDIPTRKEAREIKRSFSNAKIERRQYQLVNTKIIR